MSEYWKSTPKYWCKHCSVFVRDTKLERQNHETTAKHQGSLKRFLRDLHRGHENEERDKERARREVERLNGVVSGPSSSTSRPGQNATPSTSAPVDPAAARQRQMEQLAELGVSIPTEFRGDMSLPGEWTVTSTRVVTKEEEEGKGGPIEAKALGVRKRELTEDEQEAEEAMKGLFKKPKKWGRDLKTMPEDDTELEALLSGSLLPPVKNEEAQISLKEEYDVEGAMSGTESKEPVVKREPVDEPSGLDDLATTKEEAPKSEDIAIKAEDADISSAPVVFKKRKPKNIRQK